MRSTGARVYDRSLIMTPQPPSRPAGDLDTHTAPLSIGEVLPAFRQAVSDIETAYALRKPKTANQVTPPQLREAFDQVLNIATNLSAAAGGAADMRAVDITQLGDYGLGLLGDLGAWAQQLQLSEAKAQTERMAVALADWCVTFGGELKALEPVVNGLASLANQVRDAAALEQLAQFMTRVLSASDASIKQDLEKTNPGRPWRILHFNRAIVATRSHNTALMEQVFDELIRALPDDVAQFFQEGMQQMEALNYPPQVRAVMDRYYRAWTQHRVH